MAPSPLPRPAERPLPRVRSALRLGRAGTRRARARRARARRVGAAVVAAALLLALAACGGPGAPSPADLSVRPLQGPPGTALTVTGARFDPADAGALHVTLGDADAAYRIAADGSLSVAVPLYLGPDGWPKPPSDPQTLEVVRAGRTVGRSTEGVSVTPLARAPGTTAQVQDDLQRIADAYDALWSLVPAALPQEAPLRQAVANALAGLANGGDASLGAVLAGTSSLLGGDPGNADLADAVLASSGAADYLSAYADALAAAVGQAPVGAVRARAGATQDASSGLCDGGAEDLDLACEMQIYVVLDDFTQAFVKPTVTTYGNTVGLAAGALAIGTLEVPAAGIIGAILSVGDFVMEKMAPALFPSHLTQFDLEMLKTTIDVGEVTQSDIVVAAANTPPPITVSDVIQQALTLLGLRESEATTKFEKALEAAANFDIGLYMQLISDYEGKHPGTFPWASTGVAQMPAMSWGPLEVSTDRLVKLTSSDDSVLAPQQAQIEWKGAELGEANARVMPRGPGSKAKVLHDDALCPGCVYYGGAFGNDMPDDSTKVTVGDVALTATPADGTAPLATTLAWTGLTPQPDPYTCTLDFGDGTPAATIQDCANVTSVDHTYAHTSALVSGTHAFTAKLAIVGTSRVVSADVPVDWTFTATPTQGQPPLAVTFAWSGFDPALAPFSCTFDPGDGSAPQPIASCGASGSVTHTYQDSGSYAPGLAVTGGGVTTLHAAAVDATTTPACIDASTVGGWQGSVGFSYDGSGSGNGVSISVHRAASADVTFDTLSATGDTWAQWSGHVTGGSGSFDDLRATSTDTTEFVGTNLALGIAWELQVLTIERSGDTCRLSLTFEPLTDLSEIVNGGTYALQPIPIAELTLYEPLTGTGRQHGSTLLPIYDASTDEGNLFLTTGGQGGYGWDLELKQILGSAAAMGKASVTWDLSPLPPGP